MPISPGTHITISIPYARALLQPVHPPPPRAAAGETEVATIVDSPPHRGPVLVFRLGVTDTLSAETAPAAALSHPAVESPSCCAWRPRGGRTLAVGCRGGVALFALRSAKAAAAPFATLGARSAGFPLGDGKGAATLPGGEGPAYSMEMLPCGAAGGSGVAAVEWSPCGRTLVAALPGDGGLYVWGVARRQGTRVRPWRRSARLLRWSPCGGYLFVGLDGAGFAVMETTKWSHEFWQADRTSGNVSACCWAPDGSSVAFSFTRTR